MSAFKRFFGGFSPKDHEQYYILYGSSIAFFLVLSLSFIRLYLGDYQVAYVDLGFSLIILMFCLRLWESKVLKKLNGILAFFCVAAFILALFFKGSDGLFWQFPLLGAIYFLLSKNQALLVTSLMIGVSAPYVILNVSSNQALEMYPSLILLSVFQYIWASRSDDQQSKLYDLATEDALTKIPNRRALNSLLKKIVSNSSRIESPVSLLILDLDKFKVINDSYGHNKGDEILVYIARLINEGVRDSDYFCRYGGEEFVLIANNASLSDAFDLAETLRKKVESDSYCQRYNLTISIGVAEINPEYDTAKRCFARADKALYKAKESGRNCVCVENRHKRNAQRRRQGKKEKLAAATNSPQCNDASKLTELANSKNKVIAIKQYDN